MVDKRNLNRIKGILSARKGAEIPKFNTGAKFSKKRGNVIIHSADGINWYTDPELTIRHAGGDYGFVDVSTPDAPQHYEILGANQSQGDPNAAVHTAAQATAAEAEQAQAIVAQTSAENQVDLQALKPLSKQATITPSTSINDKLGAKARADIDARVSAGMKLRQEEKAQKIADKNKAIGTAAQLGTAAFQGIGSAIGASQQATDSNLTKTTDTAYSGIAEAAKSMGPVGQMVGTAMQNAKIAGDIIQELGGGTDQQTTMDKWMDSAFFSWNIGMLNGFAGKNSDSFGVDRSTLESVGSSYGGTASDITDAASKAGKKYGLFSSNARKKANAAIAAARTKQNLMGNIADTATDQRLAAQSMGEQAGLAYSLMTDGGYNQKYTYAAKHGGMLEWNPVEILEWEPQIELNWELPVFKEGGNIDIVEELEWIPEFKSGGKTEETSEFGVEETTQKNVIPEGALHKNKHHMEHAEGLTKKGIPVIDEDGEQQAEIEHSEIIFTLEVTKKLEEYYEIFYSEESSTKEKEQAAIDAGKLLVFQILENTEDRTGLIESCKQGGTLTFKKTTDDLIEEVLEWAPTLVIVEETEDVEKPKKASENKLDKDVVKEAIKEALIELLIK